MMVIDIRPYLIRLTSNYNALMSNQYVNNVVILSLAPNATFDRFAVSTLLYKLHAAIWNRRQSRFVLIGTVVGVASGPYFLTA